MHGEPSICMESRDNLGVIDTLRLRRDHGNTALVVEHDADMIKVADHIVDLGLGAGEQSGRIVFSGTPAELQASTEPLVRQFLDGQPDGLIALASVAAFDTTARAAAA